MNNPAPETLLTKAEAKAKLGNISDGILSRLIRQGKLRAIKYGQTTPLRFRALDVERCIESLLTPVPELRRDKQPVARPVAGTPGPGVTHLAAPADVPSRDVSGKDGGQ